MDKNPAVFFTILFLLALVLLVVYKLETDPLKHFQLSAPGQNHQHTHDHENEITAIYALYKQNCLDCHGPFGGGLGSYPFINKTELNIDQIKELIQNGKGEMPAFRNIKEPELTKLAELVKQF